MFGYTKNSTNCMVLYCGSPIKSYYYLRFAYIVTYRKKKKKVGIKYIIVRQLCKDWVKLYLKKKRFFSIANVVLILVTYCSLKFKNVEFVGNSFFYLGK